MRHFIPILFITLVVSSCAHSPENLQYQSVAQNTEESGLTSASVSPAPPIPEFNYKLQEQSKIPSEDYNFIKIVTENTPAVVVRRLDNCFIDLAPDLCWYIKTNNTPIIENLAFGYLKNTANGIEDACATSRGTCGKLYSKEVAFMNFTRDESSRQQENIVSVQARVVLSPFSISINY
jgi:hypothetical protein